ncbi:Probable alkaline/neutral invertase B [Linum perenne]
MNGEPEIVKNFILKTLRLQSSIGRVAPVDSGFWWIILLRAYTRSTGDTTLAELPECQKGMRLILSLCLSEGFDTFPTLLCADGCCMIDRRMMRNYFWLDLKQLNDIYRYKTEEYSHTAVNKFNVMPDSLPSHEWRIVTGCDPKNTRWSYHNGGSWPGQYLSEAGHTKSKPSNLIYN